MGDVRQTFQGADVCRRHEGRVYLGQYQCPFPGRKESYILRY